MNPQEFPSSHQNLLNGLPSEEMKGMDLRDYFAAKAVQGLLACPVQPKSGADMFSRYAYVIADAMIKARKYEA